MLPAVDLLMHPYRTSEKLRLFLPCVQQTFRPRRHLLAGPFAGEFGYEIMQWQGFVRARRRHYEEVHVLTYPGRDFLYEDCRVHHHTIDLKSAGYWYGDISPTQMRQLAHAKAAEIGLKDYDVFDTSLLCTRYHKKLFWRQEFRLLEEPPLVEKSYDIVFHFRAVNKVGTDQVKNYPPAMADELARRCVERGITIACIGHPNYSYCPAGCADLRNTDLRQTVAAICSARATVGESSGAMHLANACGRPTILWAAAPWRVDYSLRWNPFRVPIYVVTDAQAQPAPEMVCEAVVRALKDMREKTVDFSRPIYQLPAQPIASI